MKEFVLGALIGLISVNSFAQEEDIRISKPADIEVLRSLIEEFIWKDASDSSTVTEFKNDTLFRNEIQDYIEEYTNLKSVDRIMVNLKNNWKSNCVVFHPKTYNHLGIGLIYHGGHKGFLWEDRYLNNSGRPNSISSQNSRVRIP